MFDFTALGPFAVNTLVDVGAGVGTFLGPALAYYQPSVWLAIEMLPDRAEMLAEKFVDPGGRVLHSAIGEQAGRQTIRRTVSADSSSLLEIDPRSETWFSAAPGGMNQAEDGEVRVCTLSQACEHLGHIDLMKVDVQGYEGRLIRGGADALGRTKRLIIEVLFVHHYHGQSEPDEIERALKDLGFRFDRWLEKSYHRGVLLQGDGYYVRD